MADDGRIHKRDGGPVAKEVMSRCGKMVTRFSIKWSSVTCEACKATAPKR